jgi:hypothetical protein
MVKIKTEANTSKMVNALLMMMALPSYVLISRQFIARREGQDYQL